MKSLAQSSYVEPYFIRELGCEGLTAADIAKSLSSEVSVVRRKLTSRGFLDRIKRQGYQALPIGFVNKGNGLEFTEYVLDIDASKFFVGKYDSETGDDYLAFLITLEKKVNEFDVLTRHDPILRSIAETQRLRLQQIVQEKRINEHDDKINSLEDNTANMPLNTIQKRHLKKLIDSTGYAFGDPKFIGKIQKELKSYFRLNPTNDRWYHIAQKNYKEAVDFVKRWGS